MRSRFEVSGLEPTGLVLNKLDFVSSGYGYYYKAYRRYGLEQAASAANAPEGGEPPEQHGTGSSGSVA